MRFLDCIDEYGGGLSDYVVALGAAGYGASFNALEYHQLQARAKRMKRLAKNEQRKKIEKQYYDLLHRAIRDGLIQKTVKGEARFTLTSKGIFRKRMLRERISARAPQTIYETRIAAHELVVSFDIPEQKRRDRDWLRSALKQMGFRMIQQSFWMGKRTLPAAFIADAYARGVASHIEVFSVVAKGSLDRFS